MICRTDISSLKTDITDKIGQKIIVKGSLGRSKEFEKEGTIEKLYRYMEEHEKIGQIGPKIKDIKGEISYSCRLLPTPFNLILRRFLPFRKLLENMDYEYEMRWYKYDRPMEVPILSGCFIFTKTEVFKNIGKFDERFFMKRNVRAYGFTKRPKRNFGNRLVKPYASASNLDRELFQAASAKS